MKRILIITVVFVAIVIIAAFFVSRSARLSVPAGNAPPPIAPAGAAPQPVFPSPGPLLKEPSYTMGAITGNFPASLPLFEVKPSSLQVEISRLATTFHLPGQPTTTNAIDGTYFTWATSPGLIVGPNTNHVTFSAPLSTVAPLAREDVLFMGEATKLITSVEQWYSPTLTTVSYFSPQVTELNFVAKDKATAIQLTYALLLDGIPIVAGAPKNSETVVRYNNEGGLLYYSGYNYPRFVRSGKSSPVISLQEAQARLLAGKGTILSADSQADTNTHGTKWYQFSTSAINGAVLAYYYNFDGGRLDPVFLFEGVATDRATQQKVDTVSVVSAVP